MKFLKFGSSDKFVVFLHGWGADKNSFLWVKDYFPNFSLIFLDFPGFGESELPPEPYNVDAYVRELSNLLDGFCIKSLTLVGHSFGGRVAIKFAAAQQQKFNDFKLVLVDAAGIKPRHGIRYYLKVHEYKKCKKRAETSEKYAKKLKKFGSLDFRAASGVMRKTLVNVVNEPLEKYARQVTCQTAIIWGRNDRDTPPFMAKKLSRLIKNSKLFWLDGAGHFSFLDKPNDFLIILDTFLKN